MTRLLRTIASGAAVLAVPVLAVPLLSSAPGAAVGTPGIVVNLPPSADLSSTGKAVRVRVAVTCTNMAPPPITVALKQTRSQTVVTGSGTSSKAYTCTGRSQRVPVIVLAKTGTRFNVGGATAKATATCGSTVCATDTRNVQLISTTP
jgi:hypothetical protein